MNRRSNHDQTGTGGGCTAGGGWAARKRLSRLVRRDRTFAERLGGSGNNVDVRTIYYNEINASYKRTKVGEAVRGGHISPLLIGRDSVALSHLQFADDTILFCPPEEDTIKNYKRLLRCFELMSGLSINFEKSSLIPINCEEQWIRNMCQLLGCKGETLPVKYLGIPLGANPRLVKTWKPILDRVEEKLSLWKAKLLNKAGKLVLIKSVLNSLPVYYLSLFKLPKAVAEKLISLQRRFLWSKEDGSNGMALVKWEVVQTPKKLGGLGVGDAMVRNTAMLFKWWWRFAKEDCPLWKKVVCSCYNLNPQEMLSTQVLPTRGGLWKDICQLHITNDQIRDKMVTGLSMEVGDGRRTRFWEDIWLLCGPLKERFPRLFSVSNQCGSVIGDCGFWDGEDRVVWKYDRQGVYTTNSFVKVLQEAILPEEVWSAWLAMFGQQWSISGSMREHFLSWTEGPRRREDKEQRLRCFCAIVWNIWLERNRRIFQNRNKGVEDITHMTVLSHNEWSGVDPFCC
ncbi:uncharacterized protein LOC107610679 [Arachis ipaensis]|uniref:uncharacterized protein LOC107610679 n=1 Tax=Arachis ipaensis TaxID=130454 RepID=UPI0007AF4A88|nr:uncharacterized protein LOC107610679 [Arachis ipaensis]